MCAHKRVCARTHTCAPAHLCGVASQSSCAAVLSRPHPQWGRAVAAVRSARLLVARHRCCLAAWSLGQVMPVEPTDSARPHTGSTLVHWRIADKQTMESSQAKPLEDFLSSSFYFLNQNDYFLPYTLLSMPAIKTQCPQSVYHQLWAFVIIVYCY